MKIIKLTSENVKRLHAVEISPEGAIVQITGRNGAGKSSVLDSIAMALGGADEACDVPVRRGQAKARTVVELDDLIVTRTWTEAGGTRLTVSNKEGAVFPSPQAVLDRLVGKLTLDPLAFSRLPAKQQLETLKGIVGLDFSALDNDRAMAFAARTECNRQLRAMQALADASPKHPDAPAAEVSVADLAAEFQRRQKANNAKAELRQDVESVQRSIHEADRVMQFQSSAEATENAKFAAFIKESDSEFERRVAQLREENEQRKSLAQIQHDKSVGFCRSRWVQAQKTKQEAELNLVATRKSHEESPSYDLTEMTRQIQEAEAVNRKVRDNAKAAELNGKAEGLSHHSSELTKKIESIDFDKAAYLKAAAFPVPDLSFDEHGVTFKGLPFAQASSAEQLRASVAIGLALNPKLRVLLVRDGSLLDAGGMKLLAELAEQHDCQVWVERVADGSNVGIVIEDGMVAGAMQPA